MRPQVKCFLTAAFVALMTAPALGEFILDLAPFPEGTLLLLSNKGVQKELHLTDEQRDKVSKIIHDALEKRRPDFQTAIQKAIATGDRKKVSQVVRESMHKGALEAQDKVNQAIPDILKEEQIRRLRQIELQVNVLSSLNKPDIQRKLKFTDKQKAELKRIAADRKRDIAEVTRKVGVPDASGNPSHNSTEMAQVTRKLIDEANRKALKIFTEEQKKTWKDLTGEKFEFKPDISKFSGAKP